MAFTFRAGRNWPGKRLGFIEFVGSGANAGEALIGQSPKPESAVNLDTKNRPRRGFDNVPLSALTITPRAGLNQPGMRLGFVSLTDGGGLTGLFDRSPARTRFETTEATYNLGPRRAFRNELVSSVVSITPGFIDQTYTQFAPTFTFGGINLAPGLIDQTYTQFAPTFTFGGISITPGFIDQSGSVFGPTLTFGGINLTPGFIDQSGTVFTPSTIAQILPALIDQTYAVYGPTAVAQLTPAFIDQSGVIYTPTMTFGGINLTPGFINQSGVIFTPSTIHRIYPGLIDQSGSVFGPTTKISIYPGLIDDSGSIFSPILESRLSIFPSFLDYTGQVTPLLHQFIPGGAGGGDTGPLITRLDLHEEKLRQVIIILTSGNRSFDSNSLTDDD